MIAGINLIAGTIQLFSQFHTSETEPPIVAPPAFEGALDQGDASAGGHPGFLTLSDIHNSLVLIRLRKYDKWQ